MEDSTNYSLLDSADVPALNSRTKEVAVDTPHPLNEGDLFGSAEADAPVQSVVSSEPFDAEGLTDDVHLDSISSYNLGEPSNNDELVTQPAAEGLQNAASFFERTDATFSTDVNTGPIPFSSSTNDQALDIFERTQDTSNTSFNGVDLLTGSPVQADPAHASVAPAPPPLGQPSYASPIHSVPVDLAALDGRYRAIPTNRWINSSLFHDIPPRDPLGEVFPKVYSPTDARPSRTLIRPEDVAHMSDPLLGLVDAASWRGAAVLAKRKLIETHPVQVKDIMRLWLLRLTALIRLRQFEFAYTELERLDVGNYHNVEWRYETYPDVFPGMSGCMITFEIKSLWATMPGRHGNHGESLNRLYQLVSECKGMARRCRAVNGTADDEAESVWLSRGQALQLQVASYLVELRDYRTAGAILHALSHTSVDPDILSALGRIFMQAGNVSIAQTIFKRVNEVLGSADASVRPDLVLSNSACIFMCDGDWERAAAYLTQLLTLNPSSAVCVNNLALCQLYSGNVSQAVSFLDSSIIDVPKKAGVAEQILFNLCSLYDLMDVSHERKKLLVTNVLSRFVGDDFDPSCLKL